MKNAAKVQPSRPASQKPDAPKPAPVASAPASESPNVRSGGAPNVNKVMLIGTLTRDPELRTTPKGLPVTEIGLAINRFYTTESGERREETTFVDVELWGRQAEIAAAYLRKGRPVFVEGRLRLDAWDDKQTGQKRSRLKVVGEMMQLLGSRDAASAGEQTAAVAGPTSTPVTKPRAGARRESFFEEDDGDAPF